MRIEVSKDAYETIREAVCNDINATQQDIETYAGYDSETTWRKDWIRDLENALRELTEGVCVEDKDVDHSLSEHMDKVCNDIANGTYVEPKRRELSSFTKMMLASFATVAVMATLPMVVSIFFEWCAMWGFHSNASFSNLVLVTAEVGVVILSVFYMTFIRPDTYYERLLKCIKTRIELAHAVSSNYMHSATDRMIALGKEEAFRDMEKLIRGLME